MSVAQFSVPVVDESLHSRFIVQALQHEYFNTLPVPCPLDQLPLPAGVAAVPKLQPVASAASMSAGASTNSLTDGVKSKVQGLDIGRREDEPAAKKVRNI